MQQKTQKEKENKLVLSYLALRSAVGFLGISFPFVLVLGAMLFGACSGFQNSISDYHNTSMRDVFVGILSAIALFLFAYSGYNRLDFWMAKAAGTFAFMIAIFPDALDLNNSCTIIPNQNIPSWMATVHFISAACFFLVLAYFSIVLFTKTDPEKKDKPTPEKIKRNIWYKGCGYAMLLCIVLIFLYFKVPSLNQNLPHYTVLVLESIALWAFGISWVIKGETFLKDK